MIELYKMFVPTNEITKINTNSKIISIIIVVGNISETKHSHQEASKAC